MQSLLIKYLYQNGNCPLPSLGQLQLDYHSAEINFLEKNIAAPKPFIKLNKEVSDTTDIVNYLAAKTNTSNLDAENNLFNFCKEIKDKVNNGESVELQQAGTFFKEASGQLVFKNDELPQSYSQPVFAEKVVHPNAEHSIRVGDNETTNTAMEAYFTDDEVVKKDRWWIWAIALAAIALLLIGFAFNNNGNTLPTGNQHNFDLLNEGSR